MSMAKTLIKQNNDFGNQFQVFVILTQTPKL